MSAPSRPSLHAPNQLAPILLGTWSFSRRCLDAAWPAFRDGGDGLDALEVACRVAESDPRIDSVGYGGLPDRDGEMSLDGCVMRGPREIGAVCAMRHCRHPVSVARRVMEQTRHILLAGDGADRFAMEQGFPAEHLLAPEAAAAWDDWVRGGRGEVPGQGVDSSLLRPVDDGGRAETDGRLFGHARRESTANETTEDQTTDEKQWRHHDTIGALALDANGHLAGACSTSGTPYKLRGRVGDSPIAGHALYVEQGIGAATATGTGELVMGVCGAFLAVELMRRGEACDDALRHVLERIVAGGPLTERDQVGLIALRADGTWASASLRPGYRTAVATHTGIEVVEPAVVLLGG